MLRERDDTAPQGRETELRRPVPLAQLDDSRPLEGIDDRRVSGVVTAVFTRPAHRQQPHHPTHQHHRQSHAQNLLAPTGPQQPLRNPPLHRPSGKSPHRVDRSGTFGPGAARPTKPTPERTGPSTQLFPSINRSRSAPSKAWSTPTECCSAPKWCSAPSAGSARAILSWGRQAQAGRKARSAVGRGAKPPSEFHTPNFSRVTGLARSSRDEASKTIVPFSMM
jgi:hypothetical protein